MASYIWRVNLALIVPDVTGVAWVSMINPANLTPLYTQLADTLRRTHRFR